MLYLKKHHTKQPIPDWHFRQDETLLRDKSADGLIEKIILYRSSNGLPPGNPEHEIALSLIEKHPHLVYEQSGELPEQTETEQVWGWVNKMWREAPRGTPEEEAMKERADVCKICPLAKPFNPSPELARRSYLLAQGNLRLETRCSHHRWHNGLAVLLKKPEEWAQVNPPPNCWLKVLPTSS